MSQKSRSHIFRLDSATVIGDSDIFDTTAFYFNSDSIGTCIYCIFNKFLYNTCRAFHYFTCGYLINCIIIKYLYSVHLSISVLKFALILIESVQCIERREFGNVQFLELF